MFQWKFVPRCTLGKWNISININTSFQKEYIIHTVYEYEMACHQSRCKSRAILLSFDTSFGIFFQFWLSDGDRKPASNLEFTPTQISLVFYKAKIWHFWHFYQNMPSRGFKKFQSPLGIESEHLWSDAYPTVPISHWLVTLLSNPCKATPYWF